MKTTSHMIHEDFECVEFEECKDGAAHDGRESPDVRRCPMEAGHVRRLFRLYRKTKDPAIKDELFRNYLSLACFYAWKYSGRGVDYEDLRQEACLGLLKAIEGFDPSRGVKFHTYAIWFVEGWIRQYFRDKAWICKVPRSVKGMSLQIKNLSRQLGRFPTQEEIAEHCDIPADRMDDAIAAAQTWSSVSLHHDQFGAGLNPTIIKEAGYVDEELEAVLTRFSIQDASRKALDPTELEIVRMYYFDELSQCEIARKLGTYQMMVSRSLQKSTSKLGAVLSAEEREAC